METTGDLTVYRFTSYALQCLLQHYTGVSSDGGGVGQARSTSGAAGGRAGAASPEPEGLYWEIRPDIRPLVKPYLTTRCARIARVACVSRLSSNAAQVYDPVLSPPPESKPAELLLLATA